MGGYRLDMWYICVTGYRIQDTEYKDIEGEKQWQAGKNTNRNTHTEYLNNIQTLVLSVTSNVSVDTSSCGGISIRVGAIRDSQEKGLIGYVKDIVSTVCVGRKCTVSGGMYGWVGGGEVSPVLRIQKPRCTHYGDGEGSSSLSSAEE